jgi:hypothetical protein
VKEKKKKEKKRKEKKRKSTRETALASCRLQEGQSASWLQTASE